MRSFASLFVVGLVASLSSACGDGASGGIGATSQYGTAGQDVEVARLRSAFASARAPLSMPPGSGASSLGSLFHGGSHGPGGAQLAWRCGRRDATLDTPPDLQPTAYSFVTQGTEELVAVDPTHTGETFLRDTESTELVGYAAAWVAGTIGRYEAVRIAANGDLLIEEFLRPTVATLTGDDAVRFAAQSQTHQMSVAGYGAPALSYTRCSTRQAMLGGARVVVWDDFSDNDYTQEIWGLGVGTSNQTLPLMSTSQSQVATTIAESTGQIGFSYKDRDGALTVELGNYQVAFMDDWMVTSGGTGLAINVPKSASVTIDIGVGRVVITIDGARYELGDPTAAPFVYQNAPTTLSFRTSSFITLDDVLVAVPAKP